MESTHPLPESARLTGVVHRVRDRWRLKRALRGASIVLAVAFVLLAVTYVWYKRLDRTFADVI